jgi:hypothetical protein
MKPEYSADELERQANWQFDQCNYRASDMLRLGAEFIRKYESAHAEGYAKGIEDAAAVADREAMLATLEEADDAFWLGWEKTARRIAAAIRALKEGDK